MNNFLNILGAVAAVISFIVWVPQAILVWKNRNSPIKLASISLTTQWLMLTNAIIWGIYAYFANAFWVGAPGLINAPLGVMTLYLVYRVRRGIKQGVLYKCGSTATTKHYTFVVDPDFSGRVIECNGTQEVKGIPLLSSDILIEKRTT